MTSATHETPVADAMDADWIRFRAENPSLGQNSFEVHALHRAFFAGYIAGHQRGINIANAEIRKVIGKVDCLISEATN